MIISTWDFGAEANRVAWKIIMSRENPLDAVERAINAVEKDPTITSVGYGGIPNADGFIELDAAIMLGPNHKAGAVAGLKEMATPISVARKVMEKTNSILLVGDEALKFALRNDFKKTNLLTEKAKQEWLKRGREGIIKRMDSSHDTIGLVLLDPKRDIYAGCSTSGLAMKTPGRVGDSPIIGAGLYVIDHMFFALSIAMSTYFQKIARPEDIASSAGVSFTINHIAAVVVPAALGLVWMVSPAAVFLTGTGIAVCSLVLSRNIPAHPEQGNEVIWGRVGVATAG